MKNLFQLIFLFFFITVSSYSQKLNIDYSKKFKPSNKEGTLDKIVGENSNYVYLKYNGKGGYKIKAVEKGNLTTVVGEFSFSSLNKMQKKGLFYEDFICFDKTIMIVWKSMPSSSIAMINFKNDKSEIWIETFDPEFNPKHELELVFTGNKSSVISNPKSSYIRSCYETSKLLLCTERYYSKEEKISFDYKLFDENLSILSSGDLSLPMVAIRNVDDASSNCSLEVDDNIYITSRVKMSRQEIKEKKRGEDRHFTILSCINTKSNILSEIPLKYKDKNITEFNYLVTKTAIKMVGFYSDVNIDKSGDDIHGVFYANINPITFFVEKSYFNNFTQRDIDLLFKKRSSAKDDEEQGKLNKNYVVEKVFLSPDDGVVLFSSIMNNYSKTSTTKSGGVTTTTTTLYCNKVNLTCIKLDSEGSLKWLSNIPRSITYVGGWNTYDIKAIYKDGSFYSLYGSAEYSDESGKRTKKKKRKNIFGELEYAAVDNKTGVMKKNIEVLNTPRTSSRDWKYIHSENCISFNDSTMYSVESNVSLKTYVKVVSGTLLFAGLITGFIGEIVFGNPILFTAILPGGIYSIAASSNLRNYNGGVALVRLTPIAKKRR